MRLVRGTVAHDTEVETKTHDNMKDKALDTAGIEQGEDNIITFNMDDAGEIMRLDQLGMVYKGQRIVDGGEAHTAFLAVMRQMTESAPLEPPLPASAGSALLPCPFCGDSATEWTNIRHPDSKTEWNVGCNSCEVRPAAERCKTRELALSSWNTRTQNEKLCRPADSEAGAQRKESNV